MRRTEILILAFCPLIGAFSSQHLDRVSHAAFLRRTKPPPRTSSWWTVSRRTAAKVRDPDFFLGSTTDKSLHEQMTRRDAFARKTSVLSLIVGASSLLTGVCPAFATEESSTQITDKIFLSIKGIPSPADQPATSARIVIGLYGNAAPNSVKKIKQLVTREGLPATCRPKAERVLQKEQLEANKVFNTCKEFQNDGVSLQYSTIWRIVPGQRIDVGAVTGKFVSREFPDWEEEAPNNLRHEVGTVSVRRGSDGGFGFTIYPGGGSAQQLDDEHIVVGRVIEGMDSVTTLSTKVPVITSSSVNYMSLTGGKKGGNAPDRSCRYGGPMYCNENKPLVKLTVTDSGVL